MTTLIGLSGSKESGKDSAYQFIHEWAADRGVRAGRRGFADALKLSFARLFIPDCSLEEAIQWCDILKQPMSRGLLKIEWSNGLIGNGETLTTIEHRISGRMALQRYGTEGHREVFGDDFWVDALLPEDSSWAMNFISRMDEMQMFGGFEPPEICVVSDVRYENEAERIRKLGGQVWEIIRPGLESSDDHASEAGLPSHLIDEQIFNDTEGDLVPFKLAVKAMMTVQFHMRFVERPDPLDEEEEEVEA